MPYRDDWDQVRERMIAWWAGEDIGRPAMYIAVPSGRAADIPQPRSLEQRWLDIDFRVRQAEAVWQATTYLAEAHPFVFTNLGPSIMSAYLGCDLVLQEATTWQPPCLKSWDDWRPHFDPGNRWWRLTVELTEALAEAGRDRWLTSITDLGDAFDTLSHMRGPERLCIDLIENREQVRAAAQWLEQLWCRLYDELYQITVRHGADGSCGWLTIWAPGKTFPLQCDFSCMISPRDFEELVVPELRRQAAWLDQCIYHWDGPGALPHKDLLLAIEEIDGVQWVPGAGNRSQAEWPELLRHIVGAGKKIHLGCSPEQLLALVEVIPHTHIFAHVWGLPDKAAADKFIREVEAACRKRRIFNLPPPGTPYEGEAWQQSL